MSMKTVVVTGAGGYIGVTLCERLLEDGWRVIGIDRYFFGLDRIGHLKKNAAFEYRISDIRNLTPDDFKGVDAVCDLAALSNDPAGDLDPSLTDSINHLGRLNVARASKAAGVSRYVLASSCSVYGQGGDELLTERIEPKPLTAYAKANLAAERAILPLANSEFSVTVLRQATVFGLASRMRFDLVINIMTLNAVEKGRLFINGGGRQWRPLVHVRDTAAAFAGVLAADQKDVNGAIFNVGSTNLRVINIAYLVRECIPFPVAVEVVPDDPDKRDYRVNFDLLEQRLGIRPSVTPEQGVTEIYQALKSGEVAAEPWCYTVGWYRRLLEAKRLVDGLTLDGRLL